MELPKTLKQLYRHWDAHVNPRDFSVVPPRFHEPELLSKIDWFVHERMAMWERKMRSEDGPSSLDPILAERRFCNVYRELDRQTIEFHTLLNPLRDDMSLWLLNMFYCRVVARPETIKFTGLLSFDSKENMGVRKRLLTAPYPRYGTPYVFPISVIQRSKWPTREDFVSKYLPLVMPAVADEISSWNKSNVYSGIQNVVKVFSFPFYFHWTEVLIDTAYQYPDFLDLFGRFPVGPGALPTVQRIAPQNEASYIVERLTGVPLETGLTYNGAKIPLSAENWEGICCEFRKYTNLSAGSGRKRVYTPHTTLPS